MEDQFVQKYAQLLVQYCLTFKPPSAEARTIVYRVPSECKAIESFLKDEIEKAGYFALDKKSIHEDLTEMVFYIDLVGDNHPRQLYSKEVKRHQFFQKAHILIAPFPTIARAKLAHISLDEYAQYLRAATFLDFENPIQEWQKTLAKVIQRRESLNTLHIQKIRIVSDSINLQLQVGEHRKWLGASGRNIPSFETFISPDWRTIEGTISFDTPVNKYGKTFEDIRFTFKNGELVDYSSTNKEKFDEILSQDRMKHVGEFSLTDKNTSAVKRYLASSILDENFGGQFGNMHIALGKSYIKSYDSVDEPTSLAELENIGFNDAADHIDFVNTQPKEVYATNEEGEFLLYKDGEFTY